MAVTIADVARKAGVTNGTVSRALNDYPDILPETKRRIMEAAQELGYVRNVSARNLSAKRPPNLALIISIVGAAAIWPFRESILSLLTNNEETLAVAMEYIFWVLLTQPLMGIFQNYMGVFNGSGNTRYSFVMAVIRLWGIRLPLIYAFKTFTDIGRSGVWYAMVISNFIMIFFGLYLLSRVTFEPIIRDKKIAKDA